jgi:hypothetical protein
MAEIKQLKEGDKVIYPLTSTKAIVDEEGKRVSILSSPTIQSIVSITKADYDALESKDETTLYLITE